MARISPVLLSLTDATLTQRWQLAHGQHAAARLALEGAAIQVLLLIVALVRTAWPPFGMLAVVVVVAAAWRLRHARRFARAHAAFRAAPDQGDPAAPEWWALRHAAGVGVIAACWGATDLAVMLRFDDTWLTMFTLLLQGGWAAGACVTYAGSPLVVALVAPLTMGASLMGAAFSNGTWMYLLAPAAIIHFSALLRMGRSQGRVLTSLLEAEGRAADANARLRVLSLTDPLTGLANRRCFDETLASALRDGAAGGRPLALLMVDVDHFKTYNDHYGHPTGDACLARVAALLAAALRRRTDLAARYGGEEFAAILPDMDEAGGMLVAERLRQALAAQPIAHARSPSGAVTVSIGLAAAWPCEASAASYLIDRADAALYRAKRLGRDMICVAGRDAASPDDAVEPDIANGATGRSALVEAACAAWAQPDIRPVGSAV